MSLVAKLEVLALSLLFGMMAISISYGAYETPESYLEYCKFTEVQTSKILELSKTTRDPEHYIKWIGAIASHEMGRTFKDGETKYFAGRLAQDMKYKDFNTQAEAWTKSYNKYWWKNNTASDWIQRSRYCVSDTHGGGEGCPNRVRNVPSVVKLYAKTESKPELIKTVANKSNPEGTKIRKICKIVYRAEYDGYVQVDRLQQFFNRVRGVKRQDAIFYCRDIK